MKVKPRYHYIDWIRVLAFGLLIFFHSAMPFVTIDWEVKNEQRSEWLTSFIWWLHQWRLPLLFFISGAGMQFSLRSRSVGGFVWERTVRLLIPLLFAMFFTIPLQVWVEFTQKAKISLSYLDFYPQVWQFKVYPDGPITWSHLWFVVYLYVFILLLAPFLAVGRAAVGRTAVGRAAVGRAAVGRAAVGRAAVGRTAVGRTAVGRAAVGRAAVGRTAVGRAAVGREILLALPLMLIFYWLYLKWPVNGSLTEDWFNFVFSLTMLLYGYFIGGNESFWNNCEQHRKTYAAVALTTALIQFYFFWKPLMCIPQENNWQFKTYTVLNCTLIWTTILAICGFAKKYLNHPSPTLTYLNQAVYPFYIIHQTVIVYLGYHIVQWDMPMATKFLLLSLLSVFTIWMLYDLVIKRTVLTRFLFGVKPNRK